MKIKFYTVLVGLHFVFLNHALITYYLGQIGLAAWKQLLTIPFGLICLLAVASQTRSKLFPKLLMAVILATLAGALTRIENVYGIVYQFSPVLLLAIYSVIASKMTYADYRKLEKRILYISSLTATGFLIDYYFEFFSLFMHTPGQEEIIITSEYRPVYTLGSSTLLFLALSCPLVVSMILHDKLRLMHIIYICLALSSIYFSGSRSSLLLFVIFITYITWRNSKIMTIALIIFSASFLVATEQDRLLSVFSVNDAGNVGRLYYWILFIDSLTTDTLIVGPGFGAVYAPSWKFLTSHFESSIIGIYFQSGLVGLLILFFLVILFLQEHQIFEVKIWIMLVFLQILVSPTLLNYVTMSTIAIVSLTSNSRRKLRLGHFRNENHSNYSNA